MGGNTGLITTNVDFCLSKQTVSGIGELFHVIFEAPLSSSLYGAIC